jgi:hypothetical protein
MKTVKPMLALAFAAAGAATALLPATAQAETPASARLHVSTPEGEFTVLGTCGDHFSPTIPGGAAEWSVICRSGYVYMDGWVTDTRVDNACAAVMGVFPNSPTQYASDCNVGGGRTNFTFKGTGTTVNGYLYLV